MQDIRNVSYDNMEKTPRIAGVGGPREEQLGDEGGVVNTWR
jgi:hypothetical protein